MQAETGATLRVAKTMQVPQASARFRRYAQARSSRTSIPLAAGGHARPPRWRPAGSSAASPTGRPVGVVACITSYNFPITNMAGKIGPALAMGNTVVVKPAPQDPLGVIELGELFDEAGFPPGVVNVVVGADAARPARRSSPRPTST